MKENDYSDVVALVQRERNITKERSRRLVSGAELQKRMAVGGYYSTNVAQ